MLAHSLANRIYTHRIPESPPPNPRSKQTPWQQQVRCSKHCKRYHLDRSVQLDSRPVLLPLDPRLPQHGIYFMQRSVEPRSPIARSLIDSRIVRFPSCCWRMVALSTQWGATREEGQGKVRVGEGYLVENVLGASGISCRTRADRPRPSIFTYHMHCRSTLILLLFRVTVLVATSQCACLPR